MKLANSIISLMVMALTITFFTSTVFAANFSFKDLNGKQRSLADYRGKWVFVNYWATYCGPCRKEVPILNAINNNRKAVVIAVEAGDSSKADIKRFIRATGFRVLITPGNTTSRALGGLSVVPTTYVVSPEGRVTHVQAGEVNLAQLRGYMKSSSTPAPAKKKSKQQQVPKRVPVYNVPKNKNNRKTDPLLEDAWDTLF